MPIVPETKDWTWVLQRRCPQCGFDAVAVPSATIAATLRERARAWRPVLVGANGEAASDAARRPDDSTWSPLEYAAHVRGACAVFHGRLQSMLAEEDPQFLDWDQDAAAQAERYNEQSPAAVYRGLVTEADALAAAFAAVPQAALARTGRRSDGAVFTVQTLALYLLHDALHHFWDVTGQPAA